MAPGAPPFHLEDISLIRFCLCLLGSSIVGLAIANDLGIIQRKGAVHDLVAGVAFPGGQVVLAYGGHNTHMADVDAAGSVGPAEVDIVAGSGHIGFLGCGQRRIQMVHSAVVADEASLVLGILEVEATAVGVVDEPDHAGTTVGIVGDHVHGHARVHRQPVSEAVAPFTGVAVEVSHIITTQLRRHHEEHAIHDAGMHRGIQHVDVVLNDIGRLATIQGFIPTLHRILDEDNTVAGPDVVPAGGGGAGLAANVELSHIDLTVSPVGNGLRHGDILFHDIAGIAVVVGDVPLAVSIEVDDRDSSIVGDLNKAIRRGRSGAAHVQGATGDFTGQLGSVGQIQQGDVLLHDEACMGAIGGSIPGSVVLGNDEQGFVGNAREDGSGRIRSRAKIEATASDGAENASDHFVTSFLVLWHRKGGASFRSSALDQ